MTDSTDGIKAENPERKKMINRLRRIEGQIRGIQRMIDEEQDCLDVLLQLSAARKALQNACIEVIKNDLSYCILSQKELERSEDRDINIKRIEKLIKALVDIAPAK